MQLIAQYPITEAAISPHCGRPVGAMLANGDVVCGVLKRVVDGNIVLEPLTGVPDASVTQIKKSIEAKMKTIKVSNLPAGRTLPTAKTKAWGYPGYGGFGWGAGWPWILPLFLLTALFTLPFFWV